MREYQLQVHDDDPDFHGLINLVDNAEDADLKPTSTQAAVTSMLSSHLLGPLFLEYEANAR